MISFRVTVEEYERFHKLCLEKGLRNVSEVIRLAVNHLLQREGTPSEEVSLFTRVAELESRLACVEEHLVQKATLHVSQ